MKCWDTENPASFIIIVFSVTITTNRTVPCTSNSALDLNDMNTKYSMAMHPLVTVLMPVYNGENTIRDAIESILRQTYREFEFLIIDDGSTDKSVEIVRSYRDSRIRLVSSEQNSGIAASLNHGVNLATGKYLARMDCDDLSLPERLNNQVEYMEQHPETGVLGTGVYTMKHKRPAKKRSWPESDPEIKINLLFQNSFFHPSVMLRKSMLGNDPYPTELRYAQDYGLWISLASRTQFANLAQQLVQYRTHSTQVTKTSGHEQAANARTVRQHYLTTLFASTTAEEIELHHCIAERNRDTDLEKAGKWLENIIEANRSKQHFPDDLLCKVLARKWWNCCKNSNRSGKDIWHIYNASYLSGIRTGQPRHTIKYALKWLLK